MTDDASFQAWATMRELTHLPAHLDAVHQMLAEHGLRPGVGKALAKMPLDRPVAMRELAARLRCDNSYITSIVDSLEESGVATREPHPTDRRIKVVRLTGAGVALAKRIQAEMAEPPAVFDRLSPEETVRLRDLLQKLAD